MQRRALLSGLAASATIPLGWPARDARAQGDQGDLRDWFIFLETGRPLPQDKAAVAQMQRGHLDNFKRLFAAGQLLAAGPLRDPARVKRGIVVLRAASHAQLLACFQPDEYVREGYMSVQAQPARVWRALNSTGIDPEGIEENRIALLSRGAPEAAAAQQAHLQQALAAGQLGAWYSLAEGPVAQVLFSRGADETVLRQALAGYPGLATQQLTLEVWPQWLGRGVLR